LHPESHESEEQQSLLNHGIGHSPVEVCANLFEQVGVLYDRDVATIDEQELPTK
jgi:hypothetical protein